MAFGPSIDPLILLAESGLATHASDPALVVDEIAGGLAEDGRRLKRSLRSASEMPLKEAFTFDLWFSHTPDRSTP